jgi:hypothetical protein
MQRFAILAVHRHRTGRKRCLALAALLVILSGCGGGSDSNASSGSLPLQAGYGALIREGEFPDFVVSGDCSGTASIWSAASVPTSFEGTSANAIAESATYSFTNCTPGSTASTGMNYYDSSNRLLGGTTSSSTTYAFVPLPTAVLPSLVRVGDSGDLDTVQLFSDSTKTATVGRADRSYVVERDVSESAIVNFISRRYDNFGLLLVTTQSRYRIDSSGAMAKVSIESQYGGPSNRHLLLTRR